MLQGFLLVHTFVFVGSIGTVSVSIAAILRADAVAWHDALEVVRMTSGVLTVLLVRPVVTIRPSVAAPSARDAATRTRASAQYLVLLANGICKRI